MSQDDNQYLRNYKFLNALTVFQLFSTIKMTFKFSGRPQEAKQKKLYLIKFILVPSSKSQKIVPKQPLLSPKTVKFWLISILEREFFKLKVIVKFILFMNLQNSHSDLRVKLGFNKLTHFYENSNQKTSYELEHFMSSLFFLKNCFTQSENVLAVM